MRRARSATSPSPLVGEGGVGGREVTRMRRRVRITSRPLPLTPPHKSLRPGARKRGPGGEGNRSEP